jgi:hypothetical protein
MEASTLSPMGELLSASMDGVRPVSRSKPRGFSGDEPKILPGESAFRDLRMQSILRDVLLVPAKRIVPGCPDAPAALLTEKTAKNTPGPDPL